jgi:hypothetical protein
MDTEENDNDQQDAGKEPEEDEQQRPTEEVLLSPRSMAVAAVTDAMQEKQQQQQQIVQEKQDHQDTSNDNPNKSKRPRKQHKTHDEDNLHSQLEEIWKGNGGEESSNDTTNTAKAQAVQATFRLIADVMNELMQDGLEAFHRWEQAKKQVQTLKEEGDSKDRELGRLRTSEQKSRESITVSHVKSNQVYCYVQCGWTQALVYSIVRLVPSYPHNIVVISSSFLFFSRISCAP